MMPFYSYRLPTSSVFNLSLSSPLMGPWAKPRSSAGWAFFCDAKTRRSFSILLGAFPAFTCPVKCTPKSPFPRTFRTSSHIEPSGDQRSARNARTNCCVQTSRRNSFLLSTFVSRKVL